MEVDGRGTERDVAGFEVLCTDHQMPTQIDFRLDIDDVLTWFDKVWDDS